MPTASKAKEIYAQEYSCPQPGRKEFCGGDVGADDFERQPPEASRRTKRHPDLNGQICDRDGNFLAGDSPPPLKATRAKDDYTPYKDDLDFHLADLIYRKIQMSAGDIDALMQIWAAKHPETDPPFADHTDLYSTIDATDLDHIPWQSFEVCYNLPVPPGDTTPWKRQNYTVYFRDARLVLRSQLANPDFKDEMDYAPKQVFAADETREYEDFMSGNWAWNQATEIARDPKTHGAVFVPFIAGSDKTTVSVATGQNDYPLYASNGLVHNNFRRAHRNAVALIGFLAIPKTDREHDGSAEFRTFRRNLFHGSLKYIFESLREGMTTPEVALSGDGHYRRVIYGLGPYIADYPEQVLLTCVVQGWCPRCTANHSNLDGVGGRRTEAHTRRLFKALDIQAMTHKSIWDDYGVISDVLPFTWTFPRADIYNLIADLLHQIIKGTFKDHLVTWVGQYVEAVHTKKRAAQIMADIDRRIAAVPPFPGLRRFPEGRNFKQWTGDDSKALMKVYLPAIEGHVPPQMLRAFSAFLDFCYLVRRNTINEATLTAINGALARYHKERVIFEESGVCPNGFSLPRQHSLPWRRSSRHNALEQMLTINDRLDKLAAARVDFTERGMLDAPAARRLPSPEAPALAPLPTATNRADYDDDDEELGATDELDFLEVKLAKTRIRHYPRSPAALGDYINIPMLPALIRRYLYGQEHADDDDLDVSTVPLDDCPDAPRKVKCFPSAIATFYAPSDQSGLHGATRERIRAEDAEQPGFRGLLAARVLLFLSFKHRATSHECAVGTWFSSVGREPCEDTGMWMVEPDLDARGRRMHDIITYYINKYADHHSHEIAF
ncbi:hypothetical protein R3P38DRAFT_3336719 [Favolaschia claudopus]|uniref:Uncharacterized protein n=1 Tax=Favolaschia claudopus TaxID=2862362 RepID=A0AAV9Z551_9AGAR